VVTQWEKGEGRREEASEFNGEYVGGGWRRRAWRYITSFIVVTSPLEVFLLS
jgi:hypothetical protein